MSWKILALAFVSTLAHAGDETVSLQSQLESSLARVEAAVSSEEPPADVEWQTEMQVWHLNISPYARFGVEGVAGVTVAPEIEFIFEKDGEKTGEKNGY